MNKCKGLEGGIWGCSSVVDHLPRQKRKNKLTEEEMILASFLGDVVVHVENLKESTK
jgi:hypothetical protein